MTTQGGGTNQTPLRDRRVARVIDREIAPVWHDRFARLILRNLPLRAGQFVLDLHCGPGHTTAELLQRLDDTSRVLAIEPDDTLIEVAKTRVRAEWKNRVYFKPGDIDELTSMGSGTYDLVVANLVLGEGVEIGAALGELLRVTRPGGQVLATIPLWGTWGEVEDIFGEVLRDSGLHGAHRRLERLRGLRPLPVVLSDAVRNLGIRREDYVIEHERLQMLFPSGREFLFAPVVEHGPLRLWKAIIGEDGSPQELFWRLKEAIDVYYAGHVLAVSVVAGVVNIRVRDPASKGPTLAAEHWRHYPDLDRIWGGLAAEFANARPRLPFSDDDVDDFDIDVGGFEEDLGGLGESEEASEPAAEASLAAAPAEEPAAPAPGKSSDELHYTPLPYGSEWDEPEESSETSSPAPRRAPAEPAPHRRRAEPAHEVIAEPARREPAPTTPIAAVGIPVDDDEPTTAEVLGQQAAAHLDDLAPHLPEASFADDPEAATEAEAAAAAAAAEAAEAAQIAEATREAAEAEAALAAEAADEAEAAAAHDAAELAREAEEQASRDAAEQAARDAEEAAARDAEEAVREARELAARDAEEAAREAAELAARDAEEQAGRPPEPEPEPERPGLKFLRGARPKAPLPSFRPPSFSPPPSRPAGGDEEHEEPEAHEPEPAQPAATAATAASAPAPAATRPPIGLPRLPIGGDKPPPLPLFGPPKPAAATPTPAATPAPTPAPPPSDEVVEVGDEVEPELLDEVEPEPEPEETKPKKPPPPPRPLRPMPLKPIVPPDKKK